MKWYKLNPYRFEMEKVILKKKKKGAKIEIEDGVVQVTKFFKTGRHKYLIRGMFPDMFPYSPLQVFIDKPALKKSPPHLYKEGCLCLHGPDDVGPQTTAKVYLDWAEQWILTYERWLREIPWPKTNISRL